MKNDNNTYDIFLSYRRVGGFETAKHLFDLLVRDGYRVSFDIDTLRSGDFDIQLLHRIDQCTDFILILNAGAFDRSIDPASDRNKDWMRIELAYALEKKKNIIPIMLNGFTDFPDNLPDDIAAVERKNGPKYDSYYFDAFYHKLLRFLESEPIINTTTNKNDWDNSNDDSLLKIRTDLACRVLIDGEERATAHPDKITRIPLRGGSYQLQFVSLENEADKITIDTYRIEKDIEELYTVSLLPVKQTRKEKEERAIRREKEEEERKKRAQEEAEQERKRKAEMAARKENVVMPNYEGIPVCIPIPDIQLGGRLYPVNQYGKWGFAYHSGKIAIPCQYDQVWDFLEVGFDYIARVNIRGKFGFISMSGDEITPVTYNHAEDFSEGLAAVRLQNGKWGYIDATGKEIIPPIYDFAESFSCGRARVKIGRQESYIEIPKGNTPPHENKESAPLPENPNLIAIE